MTSKRAINPDIRPGKNTTGSTLAVGTLTKIKASPTVEDEVDVMGSTDDFFGVVANEEIVDDGYGDIQVGGRALVLAGGSVPIGSKVSASSSGLGVAATTGTKVVGIAITLGASGELFEVELGKGTIISV